MSSKLQHFCLHVVVCAIVCVFWPMAMLVWLGGEIVLSL